MKTWDKLKIKDLGRVVTGKTPPTDNAEYFDGDELFVSPKDLSRDSYYVHATETRISEKALEKFRGQVIPRDTVMFTSLSFAFGKMGIASRTCITNQQINSVVVGADHHPRFVYYLLRAYEPFIFAYNSGIDTPIVPKSVFEKIPVVAPVKTTQEKIAAVLSAYDDLVANNQQRIALLESMAEEIYREWFVRMRFPGAKPETFEKGLPPGWKHDLIGGAFKFFGGATPSKDVARYWTNGDVNWFTPTDITAADGIYLESSRDRCTEDGLAECSANLFPAYSVMMTSRATIGAIGINTATACTNQGFITCIPNDQYPLTYLYHWLKLAKPHFEMLSGGATFAELTKGTFKRIRILTPDIALVGRYEKLTRPMFDEMESLQKANGKLQSTRDALLPRLISGKLRVDQLNIQAPPSMRADTAPAV